VRLASRPDKDADHNGCSLIALDAVDSAER